MKALIIGGTKGFGKEISKMFIRKGYAVIIIGRTKANKYNCDIQNSKEFKITLQKIKNEHQKGIDIIVFVVGFAEPKEYSQITEEDWFKSLKNNLVYVAQAIKELEVLLLKTKQPKVITIGSQWSYKLGNRYLIPYIVSKHALRTLTLELAKDQKKIKYNHYCVPTMKTPGYSKVRKGFLKVDPKRFNLLPKANPKEIAKLLVEHIIINTAKGQTFVINRKVEKIRVP